MYSPVLASKLFLDEVKNKRIYNIPLSSTDPNQWGTLLNEFVWTPTSMDGVLLDAVHEAPDEWRVQEVYKELLALGVPPEKILWIDSGFTPSTEIKHVSVPMFIRSYSEEPVSITPISKRSQLFLILARDPKPYRVEFILKILDYKLDNQSVVTCGSSHNFLTSNWPLLVPESNPHFSKFPILLNSKTAEYKDVNTIEPEFKTCLVNVVLETGFEPLDNVFGGWDRHFYTEKTGKAFFLEQIPVFVAKAGYVKLIRNLGFDVFDDIIDHSYDGLLDPRERISAVANECQRLSTAGLETLKATPMLQERLTFNKNHRIKVALMLESVSEKQIKLWLNSL